MPFDPNDPNPWLDHISENPPFIRSLCKSLYHESFLVRLPLRAWLCDWGMTSQGRVGPMIPELPDADEAGKMLDNWPQAPTVAAGDAKYAALVRQEDPESRQAWAHAVAAFKYAEGVVPQAAPGADAWQLRHVYEPLTRWGAGGEVEANRAAKHYTQSAGWVALHPLIHHLMAEHPCILKTLQARVFSTFKYDPEELFAPGRAHNNCGFVVDDA